MAGSRAWAVLKGIRVDDWVFGVSSVSKDGFESPVASAVPGGAFKPWVKPVEDEEVRRHTRSWARCRGRHACHLKAPYRRTSFVAGARQTGKAIRHDGG